MGPDKRSEQIRSFVLANIADHPHDIVVFAAQTFKVSKTAVHRQVEHLIDCGKIARFGRTRSARYVCNTDNSKSWSLPLANGLRNDEIWERLISPMLQGAASNVKDICAFGLLEILTNATEHAQGQTLTLKCSRERHGQIVLCAHDDGVGIFDKISQNLGYSDRREAIVNLAKGKVTTLPELHRGEGLFFTSRVFDRFYIFSKGLSYRRCNDLDDWGIESCRMDKATESGTMIKLAIDVRSKQTKESVLRQFSSPGIYSFDKTHVHVDLAKFPEDEYITRQQAKRLLNGLEKFGQVTLDFKRVQSVGQSFVDEVFREFKVAYPEIQLECKNMNDDVTFMVHRTLAG